MCSKQGYIHTDSLSPDDKDEADQAPQTRRLVSRRTWILRLDSAILSSTDRTPQYFVWQYLAACPPPSYSSPFPFPPLLKGREVASPPLSWTVSVPIPQPPQRTLFFCAQCCHSSLSRRHPRPPVPMRMGKFGTRSPRRCRASIAASASGQFTKGPTPSASSMLYIGLHCSFILGVWSMSRDMSEPIPRKSPLPVAGLVAERHLGDGERLLFAAPRVLCPASAWIGALARPRTGSPMVSSLPPLPNPRCPALHPQTLIPLSLPTAPHPGHLPLRQSHILICPRTAWPS